MQENQQKSTVQTSMVNREDGYINWTTLFNNVFQIRKKLYIAAILGAIVGLIVAVSIPKQYAVSVVVSPESMKGGSSRGLASLATSFLGGSVMGNGADALNVSLAPEIVSSTPFLIEMLESKVVDVTSGIDTTLAAYMETEKAPWWNTILNIPGYLINGVKGLFIAKTIQTSGKVQQNQSVLCLSADEISKIGSLRSKVAAVLDSERKIIRVNASFQNPVVTATVADSLVTKIQKYIINYQISKAKDDCAYWENLYNETQEKYYASQQKYAKFLDANSNVIYQSSKLEQERLKNDMMVAFQAFSQVAQEYQMAQAKVQMAKPVFKILEPAVVPLRAAGISKLVFILGAMVAFVVGAATWYLCIGYYWKKMVALVKDSNH